MKKILSLSFVFTFFILGVFLLPSHKADAAVTVSVTANGQTSLSVAHSTTATVNIEWSSSGATSCTNNFNSSTATSGSFPYTPTTSKTFNVNCTDGVFYFKLCPNPTSIGAGTYYTTGTAGSYSTGQKVTGAIWCNSFYEYFVCGSSSSSNAYTSAGYGEISVTGSVCPGH